MATEHRSNLVLTLNEGDRVVITAKQDEGSRRDVFRILSVKTTGLRAVDYRWTSTGCRQIRSRVNLREQTSREPITITLIEVNGHGRLKMGFEAPRGFNIVRFSSTADDYADY